MTTKFTRITKREAKRRFVAGQAIYLCPRKMRPGMPFNMATLVYGGEYLEKAARYRDHPTLWMGSVEETAWDLMYRNWLHYNASNETGYYPHYYVEEDSCPSQSESEADRESPRPNIATSHLSQRQSRWERPGDSTALRAVRSSR